MALPHVFFGVATIVVFGTARSVVKADSSSCGPGTKWDPATSLCVASAGAVQRAARQAPNIQTEGGDLIFGVRNGKRVGYQVGDSVVNFDDLQLKKEDDAGARRDFAAMSVGARIGKLEATNACEKSQAATMKRVDDVVADAKQLLDKSALSATAQADEKIATFTSIVNGKLAAVTTTVGAVSDAFADADSALETKLTKLVAGSKPEALGRVAACSAKRMFHDVRCVDKAKNPNGCYGMVLTDHCLCPAALTKGSDGKYPTLKDFDTEAMCGKPGNAVLGELKKADKLEFFLPMDKDTKWLADCVGKYAWSKGGQVRVAGQSHFKGKDQDLYSSEFYSHNGGNHDRIAMRKNIDLPGDFTIEAWVFARGTGTSGHGAIFTGSCHSGNCDCGKHGGGSHCGYILRFQGNNRRLGFEYYTSKGAGDKRNTADKDLPFNKWVHVAVSRQGSTLCFYFDGASAGCHGGWNGMLLNGNAGHAIGASWMRNNGDWVYPHHHWQGYLDQVGMYHKAFDRETKGLFYEYANCKSF